MGTVGGSYSYNALCDVCGFQFKAAELRKRWDGLMVCKDDFEHRHPMDFYRVKDDNHPLPFTRNETLPTLHDPYLVPHTEQYHIGLTRYLHRITKDSPSYKSTTWWTPTTRIQLRGWRWWMEGENLDRDPSVWRFRVMDYHTRLEAVGAVVPVKRFRPGWNYIYLTDTDLLAPPVVNKSNFYEMQHFQIEVARHVSEIGISYINKTPATPYVDETNTNFYTAFPAVVERDRHYYSEGTYGTIPAGYPINYSITTNGLLVEPVFSVVVPADNSGLFDKRYMAAMDPTPINNGAESTYGNKFTCNKNCTVTHLRIWAPNLAINGISGQLRLYDVATGTLMGGASISCTENFYWHDFSIAPIALEAGKQYVLAHFRPAGSWDIVADQYSTSYWRNNNTNFTLSTGVELLGNGYPSATIGYFGMLDMITT